MSKSNSFTINASIESAKTEFSTLFKNPKTLNLFKFSLITLGLSWILYAIFYQFMPPLVPLLFSRPWGQSQLISKNLFILLPASVTILFLINLRISSITLKIDALMAIFILSIHLLCSLLAITTLFRLMILLA